VAAATANSSTPTDQLDLATSKTMTWLNGFFGRGAVGKVPPW
jgi:hypothetical protein